MEYDGAFEQWFNRKATVPAAVIPTSEAQEEIPSVIPKSEMEEDFPEEAEETSTDASEEDEMN